MDGIVVENVSVVNLTQNKGTVTNEKGYFSIKSIIGDTIQFSSLGYLSKLFFIEKENKFIEKNTILLSSEVFDLGEVLIQPIDSIVMDMTSLGLKESKKLTHTERKLYTASSSYSQYAVSLDYILNSMNGKIKKLKKLKKWEEEDEIIKKIRLNLPNTFFTKTLQIEEDNIYSFLLFCVEDRSMESLIYDTGSLGLHQFFIVKAEQFSDR